MIARPKARPHGGRSKAPGKRSASFVPDPATMWSVYLPGADGHNSHCIGFILARGQSGFEAYDAADHTLGIFPTAKSAADAISGAAR